MVGDGLADLGEPGYLPVSRTAVEWLFQATSEPLERRSPVLTSNLHSANWSDVPHTERLTAAPLDRVTHRAPILEMDGPSYRPRESLPQRAASASLEGGGAAS